MAAPISEALEQQIRNLLNNSSLSQRQIAKRLGLAKSTIGKIAKRKIIRRKPQSLNTSRPGHKRFYDEPSGPPERCPGCGGLVFMPCQLCRARGRAV